MTNSGRRLKRLGLRTAGERSTRENDNLSEIDRQLTIYIDLNAVYRTAGKSPEDLIMGTNLTSETVERLGMSDLSALRFSTIAAVCRFFDCEPGDFIKRRGSID